MPNFDYTARDNAGTISSGSVFADDERALRESLRNSGLYLTKYRKIAGAQAKQQTSMFRPRKVKLNDMVVMSRQMATLVRAGIPIVEALHALAGQTENPVLQDVLRELRLSVLAGSSMSEAMRQHPKVFNELYISLVAAGEAGGVLDQTLEVAAENFDKEAELREQVKAALVMPAMVVIACVGVVVFMLYFIVPVFANVYKQFKAELPAVTKTLMLLSDVLRSWTLFVVIGGVVGVYLFKRYYASDKGKHKIDAMLLKMPLLGKVLRKMAIARFTQTFAGATKGGIPILKALNVAASTAGNVIIKDAILGVAERVQEGSPLAAPLDETGQFPPMVTQMIASGEKAGNLDLMLEEVSKFYQRDVDYAVKRLTKMIEPIMTVVVGAIVLFVLLALYMPIFNLSNVIKR